jgi:hypothetical protein
MRMYNAQSNILRRRSTKCTCCASSSSCRSDPDEGCSGNGLLLFFRLDDFDGALGRARFLGAPLAQEPQLNPAIGTLEFALWDPDGYYVMVSALALA